MDKSVYICRTDISAHDLSSIHKDISLNLALIAFIICNIVCIAHHGFTLILCKVKPLSLLDLVIAGKYLIELRRDSYLLALGLLGRYFPTELPEKCNSVFIGLDL